MTSARCISIVFLVIVVSGRSVLAQAPATSRAASDREATLRAASRAQGFLKSLAPKIDPVRLRSEHRMKGVKFYVEYLNAWRDIYEISDEPARKVIRAFLAPIVARTDSAEYHDLAGSSDKEFKEDIISYLSACVLHGQFGFDTARYRREVDRIVSRALSPGHLDTRGINNTMGLVYRLRQLGHEGGPSLCGLWGRPRSVTRLHPDLTKLDLGNPLARQPVYDMTHEIFYLTEFGRTPCQCVSEKDLKYIRLMHVRLIPIFIEKKDSDALAELVMDLNFLHMTSLAEYATARDYLLRHQNEDGSWGDRDHIAAIAGAALRVNPKYLPDVGQYLHTTEVTLNGLCTPLSGASSRATAR